MKIQRIAVGITVLNLILTMVLLTQFRKVNAKEQTGFAAQVLRGQALEIVDSLGKVRSSISIQPPVTMDGKKYPETVLLRLSNEHGKPVVKIGANGNGAGLSFVNTNDEGIIARAEDNGSLIKIQYKGKERVLEP